MEDKKELNLEEMEGASGGDAHREFFRYRDRLADKYGGIDLMMERMTPEEAHHLDQLSEALHQELESARRFAEACIGPRR